MQVVHLELKELFFFFASRFVNLVSLLSAHFSRLEPLLDLKDLIELALLLFLQVLDLTREALHAVLGLQLLPHSEGDCALVQSLVGLVGLLDVLTNAEEQHATGRLVQCHLPDKLIEALREELLSHRAEASLPRLAFKEFLIEQSPESGDVDSRRCFTAHILHVMLAYFSN